MTNVNQILALKSEIVRALLPLINRDYWLLEVPRYPNVGDTLIWQGEMDFLQGLPYKCKGMTSRETKKIPAIKSSDLILFQGGGNFGDLYPKCHNYRKMIMEKFPENQFVVFPQTVHYDNEVACREDASFFSRYDVTICARDKKTYCFLSERFTNKIVLVPDMAFCMNIDKWAKAVDLESGCLLLKRADKELREGPTLNKIMQREDVCVSDWRPMLDYTTVELWRDRILRRPRKMSWLYESYMYYVYRPYLIRSGVKLLNPYAEIYTTRLHACILSVLLGKKQINVFDNTYGKNSSFYETWLSDCDSVRMLYE